MIQSKSVVVVSRKWGAGNPIQVDVTADGISIGLTLDSFLDLAVEQIGNPTMLVTKKALRVKLASAAEEIVREAKQSTKQVM
jgi:hypothetical protein